MISEIDASNLIGAAAVLSLELRALKLSNRSTSAPPATAATSNAPKRTVPILAMALQRMRTEPPPDVASHYQRHELRQLIALAWQLHREHQGQEFYLSWGMAGKCLGILPEQAGEFLRLLVEDGVLARTTKPDKRKRTATRYRWTASSRDSRQSTQQEFKQISQDNP